MSEYDDSTEVVIRTTSIMQKVSEMVTNNGGVWNKKQLVAKSVENNVEYIHSKLYGQKSIKDFVVSLDSDVEWMNINMPNQDIECKLDVTNSLNKRLKSDIEKDYMSTLNECVRSSQFSRSSIIRACIIRELHIGDYKIPDLQKSKIKDRWIVIDNKLREAKGIYMDKLYRALDKKFIMAKAEDRLEQKNIYYIVEHYKQFKERDGYSVLEEYDRGNEIIDVLESIVQQFTMN